MATLFRIKNWRKLYETNESRKFKRLPWIKSPCDLQSTGLSIIREHDEAAGILGVWELLRQYAASREAPRDGSLGRIDSPLSPRAIAIAIGLPESIVATSIPMLVSVGWIEEIKPGENRDETGMKPGDDRENTGQGPGENRKKVRSTLTLTLTPTVREEEEEEKITASPKSAVDADIVSPPSASITPTKSADDSDQPSSPIAKRKRAAPAHIIGRVLALWDSIWDAEMGSPYVRTSGGKEAASAKRLQKAAEGAALAPGSVEAAMRRFFADAFYRGKDFPTFVSHFAEFNHDRPTKGARFTKDDPLFQGLDYGDGKNGGGNPGLPTGGISGDAQGRDDGDPPSVDGRLSRYG